MSRHNYVAMLAAIGTMTFVMGWSATASEPASPLPYADEPSLTVSRTEVE